jgi:hypothetical protein
LYFKKENMIKKLFCFLENMHENLLEFGRMHLKY